MLRSLLKIQNAFKKYFQKKKNAAKVISKFVVWKFLERKEIERIKQISIILKKKMIGWLMYYTAKTYLSRIREERKTVINEKWKGKDSFVKKIQKTYKGFYFRKYYMPFLKIVRGTLREKTRCAK
jgi:hypothetical protein